MLKHAKKIQRKILNIKNVHIENCTDGNIHWSLKHSMILQNPFWDTQSFTLAFTK